MTETQDSTDGAQRIADVAARLFARDGFKGVSMATLAREAGVSKAAIFHHYPSKEALYYSVLKAACEETTRFLRGLDEGEERSDEALARFAQHQIQNLFQHADVNQLVLRELLDAESERVRTMAEEVHGENFHRLVGLIRSGQEAGMFDEAYDPAVVAVTLIGAQVFFFLAREGLGHMPAVGFADDAEAFSGSLVQLLLNGLRPR